MSNDLIALIVAVVLAVAVVGLGWRRDLAATTRGWLPRFGEEQVAVAVAPSADGRRRLQPSPQERRWVIGGYVVFSLLNATMAVFWADDRLPHTLLAGGFALVAVIWLRRSPPDGPAPGKTSQAS